MDEDSKADDVSNRLCVLDIVLSYCSASSSVVCLYCIVYNNLPLS